MKKIDPLKILYRKSSSKAELFRALAEALQVPCPAWGHPKATVFARCRLFFLERYEAHTGVEYAWAAKDAGCLQSIVKKIYGIAKEREDDHIVSAFEYLISRLPSWYVAHGFSLCVINSKFNEIISEIKNGSSQNRSAGNADTLRAAASGMGE
ncbi:MAG: hypothetical protein GDA51_01800 [Ekhidna sp.]|nr:hypothetical protein [Ekhidna sp.]